MPAASTGPGPGTTGPGRAAPASTDGAGPADFLRDADSDTQAWTLKVGETEQSYVDLDDPTHLEFDYVQRIAEAIDAQAPDGERLRVVHIGGAGLTLPRYVAHTRPTSAQIVLEPDVALTERVRERLPLPRRSGIKIRATDGRSGIAELRGDFADVIVLDAFAGAQVPADLTTVEFWNDCRRVLADKGTLMINITDKGPFGYARRVIAGVQKVFPRVVLSTEPATIKGRRFGNLVVLAGSHPFDEDRLQRAAARAAFPYRLVLGPVLDRLVAAALPFTDADSARSPLPPDWRTPLG